MTLTEFLRERSTRFRERLRRDPDRPARVFLRERWLTFTALGLAILSVGALDVWLATCGFNSCPTRSEIRAFRPPEGGRILDRSGKLMGRLKAIRRVNVPLDRVPEHVRQAFIATEDRRFAHHNGLDWRGLARATARNVASFGVREGFSTITMQVARNTFIDQHYSTARTLRRKLMELRLARLIEGALDKDQILELYLNVIYLGNGVYGVEAASRDLFDKHVEKLTIAEGAMLAALPKGPSAYTPRRDAKRALGRRNLVLDLMRREGYLDEIGLAAAKAERLAVADEEWRPAQADDSYALDAVRALVDSVLQTRDGDDPPEVVVYTTLDLGAQRAADRAVRRRAAAIQREADWHGARGTPIEGAMVALDPRTGDIRALVGGRHYERGRFNRALAGHRQPGSAFKPFVYAAALAAGFSPASLVDDEPVEIDQGGRIWRPANYGGEYLGRITLRRALMRSSNAATVRVSRAIGEQNIVALAHRNGIASQLDPVPALALGALEVTPLELVAAYAPFGNGGYRVTPRLVQRIESPDGVVLYESTVSRSVVMDPRDAYELTAMLRAVVDYGTGSAIRAWGVGGAVAGKTGTTNNGTDVWFVGYTPSLVAGFWFGFDTPRAISSDASGGRLAAPAWAEFYLNGWPERARNPGWEPPPGMVSAEIDPTTGMLAGPWCPSARKEWFKPGSEPHTECTEHYAPIETIVPVDTTGRDWLRTVEGSVRRALKKVFRF
jgi:1A family penicillin-binding protein